MRCATIVSLVAFLAAGVVGETVAGNSQLNHCQSTAGELFQDLLVDINPMPPKKGQDLKISITGNATQNIEGGIVKMRAEGRKLFIPIKKEQTNQLCELAKNGGNKCPIKKGKRVKIIKAMRIPKQAPGKLDVRVEAFSDHGDRLFCFEGKKVHID